MKNNSISYFISRSLFMGIGLSRILSLSHEYFFLTLIIGTSIGYLVLKLVNNKGKKINIFFSSLMIIIGYIILINMISTIYLVETNKLLIGIPLVFLLIYIISKKEIVISRLSNILLIINLFLFIVSVLSLIPYVDLNSFNYTNTPIKNIFLGGVEYAMYSSIPLLIIKNNNAKTYLISSLTMSLMFFMTYSILGNNLIEIIRYPEYFILKRVSIINTFEHIENIISFMWLFDIFIFVLVNANNIKKYSNKYISYILLILLLFISIILSKYYVFIIYVYKYTWIILLGYFIYYLFIQRKKRY